jgi:hypothetical protein
MAVSWLRRLVSVFSPLSPGFASESFHVGFVVDKVALGLFIFLRVLQFSPVSTIIQ